MYLFLWTSGKLVDAGVSWYTGNIFVGAFANAEYAVLPAHMAWAMWLMLVICDHNAIEYSIISNGKTI